MEYMQKSNYEIVTDLIRSAVRRNDKEARILLYGSRARGTAHEHSDWDVVVILNKEVSTDARGDLSCDIWEEGQNVGEEINAFVYTQQQWNDAPPSMFKHNVLQEAIEL